MLICTFGDADIQHHTVRVIHVYHHNNTRQNVIIIPIGYTKLHCYDFTTEPSEIYISEMKSQ